MTAPGVTTEEHDGLTEADRPRAGTHSEAGPDSVEDWLAFHAAHTHDHATQIRQNRARRAAGPPPGERPERLDPPAPRLALR